MRDLLPQPGIESRPLHWECGVLATGPAGKSLQRTLNSVSPITSWSMPKASVLSQALFIIYLFSMLSKVLSSVATDFVHLYFILHAVKYLTLQIQRQWKPRGQNWMKNHFWDVKREVKGYGAGAIEKKVSRGTRESGSNEQNTENLGTETELGGWGGLLFREYWGLQGISWWKHAAVHGYINLQLMEEAGGNLSEILGLFHFSEVTKKREREKKGGREEERKGEREKRKMRKGGKDGGKEKGRKREKTTEKGRKKGRKEGRKGEREKEWGRVGEGSYQNCVLFPMFTSNSWCKNTHIFVFSM